MLRRKLSLEGATSKAVYVEHSEEITAYIDKVCQILKPVGPTNLQLRVENDSPLLLEINPRISSSCSIRTAMGYNEPAMCVEYYLFNRTPTVQKKRKATAIRFIKDHVMYG